MLFAVGGRDELTASTKLISSSTLTASKLISSNGADRSLKPLRRDPHTAYTRIVRSKLSMPWIHATVQPVAVG
jgi:hypothetical protein